MNLRRQLEPFAAASSRKAFQIAESLIDGIITALRRNQRLAGISLLELELLLADTRADAERRPLSELRDRVHLDDIEHVEGGGL
jgi:hypothetical protein